MSLGDLIGSAKDLAGGLSSLQASGGGLSAMLESIGASAIKTATGFDTVSNRFRNASGQFQSASSAASGMFQGAMNKVGSASKDAASSIAGLSGTIKKLASGDLPTAKDMMSAVGSAIGSGITGAAKQASEALAMLGPEGKAVGVALEGLAAIAAATVGVLTTVMGLAIEVSQKAGLMKDRFAALAGGAAGGAAVQAMLTKLSASLPFASSKVNEWAQSLLVAGLQGKELEGAIKAVASAQALMGDAGAAAAQQMIQRLSMGGAAADKLMKDIQSGGRRSATALLEMGLNMRDVARAAGMSEEQFKNAHLSAEQMRQAIEKALIKKGAGPLTSMGLDLQAILQKAREGFLSLFNGVEKPVKAFMGAIKSLFSEFNKGSPLIRDLKPLVTGMLTALFSIATKVVGAIRDIFVWFRTTAKEGGIFSGVVSVIKTTWAALGTIFKVVATMMSPVVGFLKAIFSNAMVLRGIKMIFTGIAAAIGVVIVVIAALVGFVGMLVGAFAGFVGLVAGSLLGVIGQVTSFPSSIMSALTSFDIGAFVAKMAGMASAGLAAFKGIFGIASPSTVLLEHGEEDMAGAAATGVDKGSHKLKSSMAKMGDDAKPKKGKGGARGEQGAEGGGPNFYFDGCTFVGNDESGVRAMLMKVWAELAMSAKPEPSTP